MSEKPISPLRQRMLDDMSVRRFTPDTRNSVGSRIKRAREILQLTRDRVVELSKTLTERRLVAIQESADIHGNPSLIELREIANVLKTSLSELLAD